MRIILQKFHSGAGLCNELFPWAKALIAGEELQAKVIGPQWRLKALLDPGRRDYRPYFRSCPGGWLVPLALEKLIPSCFEFTEEDYQETGESDFGQAIRSWADAKGLARKRHFVILVDGLWGGFVGIRRSAPYIQKVLLNTRHTLTALYEVSKVIDPGKILVGVHVRLGDFRKPPDGASLRSAVNTQIPLSWTAAACREVARRLNGKAQFVVITDGDPSSVASLIEEFGAVTTSSLPHTAISDLVLLSQCDLLIPSISSYSMWAIFLSGSPYFWMKEHLHEAAGWLSIWGYEPATQGKDHITASYKRNWSADGLSLYGMPGRGVPWSPGDSMPQALLAHLEMRYFFKKRERDLVFHGLAKVDEVNYYEGNRPVT